jgi:hypothetical protein
MPEDMAKTIRNIVLFFAEPFLMTGRVFLRKNFGARAILFRHVVFGGLILYWVAASIEPEDHRDFGRQREYAEQAIRECHDSAQGVLYAGWSCADHLQHARMVLARSPDTLPYMFYYFVAFVVLGLVHVFLARTRARFGGTQVHSLSDGTPLLSVLTFGRFPVLSKIVLEPALVTAVGFYFHSFDHDGTALYFWFLAVCLCGAAYKRWFAEFKGLHELADFWQLMGIGQGSSIRAPTRPESGGLVARAFRTREREHAAGLARLRAFSLRNRARMLDGYDEPRPQLSGRSAREFPSAPPAALDVAAEPMLAEAEASAPRPRR